MYLWKNLASVPKSLRSWYFSNQNTQWIQSDLIKEFLKDDAYFRIKIDNIEDYNHIQLSVQAEEANDAYQKIAELTMIANEDLMSILEYNDTDQTIVIRTQPGSYIPTKDKNLTKLDNFENGFENWEFLSYST